ncbi:SoxR reducing system RseC family protein [Vibrio algivorus]|uniref:Sigma-E factor regulatory protein RseC n=1 Tax=Vibrio algivorus TaxID=1667024 RepID=A0ABQ6EPK7_9VIBR|nr:SoxR reducing system RseC family protein [Vibrio algivorus]GLT14949.1 sigma-E factor regulatory protein RseC [Vibrio algivorus]
MMTALATVISVEQEQGMNTVQLSCEQQTSCKSCKSQKSCGTGMVSKALGSKAHFWKLRTSQALQNGQVVEIGLPEKSLVLSALIVYLLPLLAMIAGSVFAQLVLRPWLNFGEGIVILMFFICGGLGIYFAKPMTQWLEKKVDSEVSLIRVLGQPII